MNIKNPVFVISIALKRGALKSEMKRSQLSRCEMDGVADLLKQGVRTHE